MNTKDPIDYQVEDFVTDETFSNNYLGLNTADQLFWDAWILNHPDKAEMVEEARNILNLLSLTLPKNEFEKELTHINPDIKIEEKYGYRSTKSNFRLLNWNKPNENRRNKKSTTPFLLIPLLLIVFTAVYFFLKNQQDNSNSISVIHNKDNKALVFTLADGTIVTLASNSTLEYPKKFNEKERKVSLLGEAQFQVVQDKLHPFKVFQDNIIATVLGTTFNVKKQSDNSSITVELLIGKLKVEAITASGSSPQITFLEPNQRAVYNFQKHSLNKEVWKQIDEKKSLNKHLIFKQSSFEEIAEKFKDQFGVIVLNYSNYKNWRFTGEFDNASAKEAMENICLIKKLNLEVRSDTFLITNASGINK